MKDTNWLCVECRKKKENYEAMYCDKCWEIEKEKDWYKESKEELRKDLTANK